MGSHITWLEAVIPLLSRDAATVARFFAKLADSNGEFQASRGYIARVLSNEYGISSKAGNAAQHELAKLGAVVTVEQAAGMDSPKVRRLVIPTNGGAR